MNVDTFLQRFRVISRAPNGVSKLRELVLQLAVTGRLFVKSKPESLDGLLSQIESERARLIEAGELSSGRSIPDVESASQHTKVPKHWHWMRLGNLTSKIGSGSTPRGGAKVYVSTGVAFLRSQNVWNDGVKLDDVVYIAESTHERMKNTRVIANDILLNITGASLGRCAKTPGDFPEANVSQHVTIIRPLLPELRHFLHICLLSPMGQSMIWGRQVGMAREGLSKKVLEQFEIPLPPLAEQQRIVAKVDELMGLCDRLESQLAERAKLLPLLSRANHARFVQEPTEEDLKAIFHDSSDVCTDDLRQTVLSLAVRGKLNNPNELDASAEMVLSDIDGVRTKHTAKKTARTDNAIRPLKATLIPFEIPKS
ncbi:MAG TPA: restriction endonuclease subunit S [Planctomycetaceae bacterium]|nr:restriction endonuclease subunit S [Planctomycetaceae bacterium]